MRIITIGLCLFFAVQATAQSSKIETIFDISGLESGTLLDLQTYTELELDIEGLLEEVLG